MRTLLGLLLWATAAAGQAPPLDEILQRLADNQERAVQARKTIVYRQDALARLVRTNGKLSREEKRRYLVTPTPEKTEKKLEHFEGRYERGGRFHSYEKPGFQYKDTDIDGDLINDLTDDLINDKQSRDGLARDMFPLTRAEQRHYRFTLVGLERLAGAEAYHLKFEPLKDQHEDVERAWAGDVWVDPAEFQPRVVQTQLALKIPMAVKIVFGIGLKQLGFNVSYKKVADGLWFPASYGTEFGIKVLFGYKRNITISVANTEFRQTSAESTITYEPGR
jgi:hypothetical protein